MSIEREVAISILKLARNEPVRHESINIDAKIPSSFGLNLLRKMQNEGLIYLRGEGVETDSIQRLKLAVRAIELGADSERVASFLEWAEFEKIAANILEMNGYEVTQNLRFKEASKRWEIDVVASRKPLVLCIDCKHWHRTMFPASLQKIAAQQALRTESLARSLPNLQVRLPCATWQSGTFMPLVLSLLTGRFKFCGDVPVVSLLQLQDFRTQFPAMRTEMKSFQIRGNKLQ